MAGNFLHPEISTRTVCPFPWTFNDSVLASLEANTTLAYELPLEACTVTMGDSLGAMWLVFQCALLVFSLTGIAVVVRRLVLLWHWSKVSGRRYSHLVQSKVYVCTLAILLVLLVESADPLTLRGWLPPAVYFVADELIPSTIFVMVLYIVDFWCICARGSRRQEGLPKSALWILSIASFFNFVGFLAVGMAFPAQYFFWEAVKMTGATLLLVSMAVVGWHHVRVIERQLMDISSHERQKNSSSAEVEASNESVAAAVHSGSGNGSGALHSPSTTDRILKQLRSKFRQFTATVAVASLAMMGNAVLCYTLEPELQSWGYSRLDTALFVVQITLHMIYMLACVIAMHFFQVPSFVVERLTSSAKAAGESSKVAATSSHSGNSNAMSAVRTKFSALVRGHTSHQSSLLAPRSTFDVERPAQDEGRLVEILVGTEAQAFVAFCTERHAEESVLCWLAIDKFDKVVAQQGLQRAQPEAVAVLSSFIMPESLHTVNVSAGNLAALRALSNADGTFKTVGANAFARVKHELFTILDENFLVAFEESVGKVL
jgi:hypothetical protein